MTKPVIHIWTDGACKGNPGPGGWGALLKSGHHQKELFGGEENTTNNRMEMTAVIQALNALKYPSIVHLHVDSQYVKKGMTEWINNWIKRGWKNSGNEPVKNADLWQALLQAVKPHEITWHWVKGHAGEAGNERADALANQGVALYKH